MTAGSGHRLVNLFRRVRRKPPRIVAAKSAQFCSLGVHYYLGIWSLYERRAERRWNPSRLRHFAANKRDSGDSLFESPNLSAAREYLDARPAEAESLRLISKQVAAGRVRVFEEEIELPAWEEVPWTSDWRFGHGWPGKFLYHYNFYEFDKQIPYDVKFPWELSRLSFLLTPTMLDAVEANDEWPSTLERILASWRRANPCANSVNWYPMECAMRGIHLVMLASLLLHRRSADPAVDRALRQVLILCELHGRFIYRAVEYSDVRGNHFVAEIVSLLLLGHLLRRHVREAVHWTRYARRFVEPEIALQYSEDGIQFEGSTAYHRLVTELFLLAVITIENSGERANAAAKQRLHDACSYVKAYTRPDGLAPLFGDSDDARTLCFDNRDHRDHRSLLAVAASFFDDPALAPDAASSVHVPLLLAKQESHDACKTAGSNARADSLPGVVRHFQRGGMVCVTHRQHHFLADVGAVGLNGNGGHGHLDACSFELTLAGIPLIIDPGSYVYTADPVARNRFRRTAAHNVVMIDGREMAGFWPKSLWKLGNEAEPYGVEFSQDGDKFTLKARHDGYARLADPVGYQRVWEFSPKESRLRVTDRFEAQQPHNIERFLHLSPGLQAKLESGCLAIEYGKGRCFRVIWSDGADAELVDDWVSLSYGSRVMSRTLVLRNTIAQTGLLSFEVVMLSPAVTATCNQMPLTQVTATSTVPPQFL